VIVDPKTGLKFKPVVFIKGDNDIITNENGLSLSPNGKFLLWRGNVVPLDGSAWFKLDAPMHGTQLSRWPQRAGGAPQS